MWNEVRRVSGSPPFQPRERNNRCESNIAQLLPRLPTLASDKTALSRSDQDPECGICYTNRGLRHKFVPFKVKMGHGFVRTSSGASLHEKKAGWVVARFLATKAIKGVSHVKGNLLPHVTRIISPTIILLAISISSMQNEYTLKRAAWNHLEALQQLIVYIPGCARTPWIVSWCSRESSNRS